MGAKKLYERLVGRLYAHWGKLYLMQDWVDPEGATDRMVAEIVTLRDADGKPKGPPKFDITDGRNRYFPCPNCGKTCCAGLSTKKGVLAVMCLQCGFRGPGVDHDHPSAEKDERVFDAWNELSGMTFQRVLAAAHNAVDSVPRTCQLTVERMDELSEALELHYEQTSQ